METGLVGCGILFWFFATFFRALWIRWRRHDIYAARINPKLLIGLTAAALAIVVHGFVDFNLHIPANALQLAIVMGLAVTVMVEKMGVGGR